jgi:hypothetical protein
MRLFHGSEVTVRRCNAWTREGAQGAGSHANRRTNTPKNTAWRSLSPPAHTKLATCQPPHWWLRRKPHDTCGGVSEHHAPRGHAAKTWSRTLASSNGRPRFFTNVTPSGPTVIWVLLYCTTCPALRSVRSSLSALVRRAAAAGLVLVVSIGRLGGTDVAASVEHEAAAEGCGGAERPRGCSDVGVGSKRCTGAAARVGWSVVFVGRFTGLLMGTSGLPLGLRTCNSASSHAFSGRSQGRREARARVSHARGGGL